MYTFNSRVVDLSILQKATESGKITKSAHPGMSLRLNAEWPANFTCGLARFSPDDKFSRHRVTIKKRYNVLLTQLPARPM